MVPLATKNGCSGCAIDPKTSRRGVTIGMLALASCSVNRRVLSVASWSR